MKAQLGPSKSYVNHRQPWHYGTQGPRRRYTERRTVGRVAQRPWIQRTRQMHHCISECRARLTREATSTSTRTQNCQLLAQKNVTVPTASLTQLRGLSSPPATPARAAPKLLEGVGQTCAHRGLSPKPRTQPPKKIQNPLYGTLKPSQTPENFQKPYSTCTPKKPKP